MSMKIPVVGIRSSDMELLMEGRSVVSRMSSKDYSIYFPEGITGTPLVLATHPIYTYGVGCYAFQAEFIQDPGYGNGRVDMVRLHLEPAP